VNKTFEKYSIEIKSVAQKGFFHLFTTNGLIIIVGFASQFFVAGILEPADIGRIKIMQTYISLATIVCGLGFNTSLLKLASENIKEQERYHLYLTAILISLFSFIIIYIILLLLSFSELISTDPVILKVFPFFALFLLPMSIQAVQLPYYQALREIKAMAQYQFFIKIIAVLILIISSYYFGLYGFVLSTVVTGFGAIIVLHKGINKPPGLHLEEMSNFLKTTQKMWKLAKFALLANIVGTLTITVDIYFINYMVTDKTQVGYYMFAATIVSIFQIFPSSIQQVAFPFFSEQSNVRARWYSSYKKYNKLNHILLFIVGMLGILILPYLINFAFKGKYDSSVIYFILLSIGWLFKSLNIMKPTSMMGHGRFDLNFYSSLIALSFTVPLQYFMIFNFGLLGAAYGMIIMGGLSYIISFGMFKYFLRLSHGL
jgi:O-antigen/teichoic acid export membrane protein